MENTTADFASTRSRALHSVSSEKVALHPIAPNTAHDNWLGDFYDPVFDGYDPPKPAKVNTENDGE